MNEPLTAATDLALAAVAAYWAFRTQGLWRVVFAALAAGAALGGAWHALHGEIAGPAARLLWTAVAWSLGVAGFALVGASARRLAAPRTRAAVVGVAAVELAGFLAWTAARPAFGWIGLHLALAMIVVAVLHARYDRNAQVLAGAATALLAGAIQQSPLRLGPFGPNDLYHLVGIVAVILLGRGVLSARPRGPGAPPGSHGAA